MISPQLQRQILTVAAPYKPSLIGVFGSYARRENTLTSDLDILVDFEPPLNLLKIIGLEQELSEQLNLKVDLVTLRSLNPQLKKYIEKDLILFQK